MGIVQKNSFWITFCSYLGAVLGYVNKILLFTAFFTANQLGLLTVMVSIAVIYAQFSALGSGNILLRFFPYFQDKKMRHFGLQSGTLSIALLGFLIFTAIFIGFRDPILSHYANKSSLLAEYYNYIIVLSLAIMLYTYANAYLRSLNRTVASSAVIEVVLRLSMTIGVSLYAFELIDFKDFVWLYILSFSIPVVILFGYIYYLGELHLRIKNTRLLKRFKKHILVYGGFSILSGISAVIVVNIDTVMVGGILDLSEAAVYGVSVAITAVLLMPYRAIIKVASPLVAEYWKGKNLTALQSIYEKTALNNLIVSGAIFLLIWANMDNLYLFIPQEYSAGKWAFFYLGIARLFDGVCGLNGTILMTSKKFKYDMFFSIALILITILTNYLLIPIWGIDGAAIATLITLSLYNILRIIFLYGSYKLFPFKPQLFKVLIIFLIVFAIETFIPFMKNVWIDIIIRSLFVSVAFVGTIYFGKFSSDFNNLIESLSKQVLFRKGGD